MHGSPVDTNVHLHGFEGPPVDENIFLSTLSTPMHACEFHVTIPATQPPGTYLYHPHAHGLRTIRSRSGSTASGSSSPISRRSHVRPSTLF